MDKPPTQVSTINRGNPERFKSIVTTEVRELKEKLENLYNINVALPEFSRKSSRFASHIPKIRDLDVASPEKVQKNETECQLIFLKNLEDQLSKLKKACDDSRVKDGLMGFFKVRNGKKVTIRLPDFTSKVGRKVIETIEKRGHVSGPTEAKVTGGELALSLIFHGIPVVQIIALSVAGYKVGRKIRPFITVDNKNPDVRELNITLNASQHDLIAIIKNYQTSENAQEERNSNEKERAIAELVGKYIGENVSQKTKELANNSQAKLACLNLSNRIVAEFGVITSIPRELFNFRMFRIPNGPKVESPLRDNSGVGFYQVLHQYLLNVEQILTTARSKALDLHPNNSVHRKLKNKTILAGKHFKIGYNTINIPMKVNIESAAEALVKYLIEPENK